MAFTHRCCQMVPTTSQEDPFHLILFHGTGMKPFHDMHFFCVIPILFSNLCLVMTVVRSQVLSRGRLAHTCRK